jgi:GxxExxY protein
MTRREYNDYTSAIIESAIEVHKELGPGLLESVYEVCLETLLIEKGILVERQKSLPIIFRNKPVGKEFYIDLLIEREIIVELKSINEILPIHEAQLITYMKLADVKLGLLINFNVTLLKNGIKRKIIGEICNSIKNTKLLKKPCVLCASVVNK